MQDDKKLCLLEKSTETESGFVICGYLWLTKSGNFYLWDGEDVDWSFNNNKWRDYDKSLFPAKFIDFSPFEDKNGRLLKDGDEVYSVKYERIGIITHEKGELWCVDFPEGFAGCPIEPERYKYISSIYLKGE